MSNSIYKYRTTENGKDKSSIPIKNNFNNKYFSKKYKTKNSPVNKNILNNKQEINHNILFSNENISINEPSKYINCKRHPQNIINYFCENDKSFLCILCCSQHENHCYKKCLCTKEYFENEILKIKKLFEENKLKYFQNKKRAENCFSKIKIHFDQEIHKINDYFDSMISILQDKKSEFIAKMLIIYENYIQKFIKYKFIFDYCDKSYYNLIQGINLIENEVYKKEDFEYFYNIKNNFVKEINNFSKYNDENLTDKKIFTFNGDSMPIFVFPEKQIVSINDDINLFGSFKNSNICFNSKENGKDNKSLNYKNAEENSILDSIYQDSIDNKDYNSIKRKKTTLEILFENNKNKNIFSSINSKISNLNDSFINKHLIDTDSTLFFLNKNEVKNVFKQQDMETSKKFDKIETQLNNNKEIKISDSPKIKPNDINKVKYTSYSRENRNKHIIKKFLEKRVLNNNNTSYQTTKQFNKNKEQSTNYNSNYLNSYENGYVNNSLNNEYFISQTKKLNKENKCGKKNKNKAKNYPPNNGIKYRKLSRKRSGSITNNNNNLKKQLNIHSLNLESKIDENNNEKKILISNKKKINNINNYFEDSFEEKNIQAERNNINKNANKKMRDLFLDLDEGEKNRKNKFIRNGIKINSMKSIFKNNINNNKNNSMLNDKINHKNDINIITHNYQRRNSFSNINFNRSKSYRYFANKNFI